MANKRKRGTGSLQNNETRVYVREVEDKAVDEEDTVDRLSDLPDHVVLKIISLLPLKEAVRTCILSKRWEDVFTSISDIDLDCFLKNKSLRNSFMNFVDRFLFLRKDISVNRFRLRREFSLDPCRINGWIHYALRHGVRELDLGIRTTEFTLLQFGVFTCRTLEKLKLSFYLSFIPSVPTNCCLQNLKVLHFSYLKLPDEESIRRLLSSCLDSLEEFLVENCDLSNINKLSVCSPKLKRLTVTSFEGPGYELEVNTPNLVHFHYYYCTETKHSFINLSSLSEARIGIGLTLSPDANCKRTVAAIDLMRAISHVRSLHLTGGYAAVEVLPVLLSASNRIPIFPKLTHLKMDGGYAGWGTLFTTSPCLETVAFDFMGYSPADWCITKEVPSGLLHRVKAVKFSTVERKHVEFIEYVLKQAYALESLVVEMRSSKREQRVMGRVICACQKLLKNAKLVIFKRSIQLYDF